MQGSVWREDGLLYVRASLIRAADAQVLWSERFIEGTQGLSITGIQEKIASQFASRIGQQHGYVLRDVRGTRLDNPNDHSLRGFSCVASAQIYRRTYHRDEYSAVRECLEATVLEDPDYARAWAMLAYVRNDAARFGQRPTCRERRHLIWRATPRLARSIWTRKIPTRSRRCRMLSNTLAIWSVR